MKNLQLTDGYKINGFKPFQAIQGSDGNPAVRIIVMKRIQKKPNVFLAGKATKHITIKELNSFVICPVGI
jgi:hypothetical protein